MRRWRGVRHLHVQTDEQVALLARLVVPELGGTDLGPWPPARHVPRAAGRGHNHPPLAPQDPDPLRGRAAAVVAEWRGERRRDVLGRLVEALVALLGLACGASCGVGLDRGRE